MQNNITNDNKSTINVLISEIRFFTNECSTRKENTKIDLIENLSDVFRSFELLCDNYEYFKNINIQAFLDYLITSFNLNSLSFLYHISNSPGWQRSVINLFSLFLIIIIKVSRGVPISFSTQSKIYICQNNHPNTSQVVALKALLDAKSKDPTIKTLALKCVWLLGKAFPMITDSFLQMGLLNSSIEQFKSLVAQDWGSKSLDSSFAFLTPSEEEPPVREGPKRVKESSREDLKDEGNVIELTTTGRTSPSADERTTGTIGFTEHNEDPSMDQRESGTTTGNNGDSFCVGEKKTGELLNNNNSPPDNKHYISLMSSDPLSPGIDREEYFNVLIGLLHFIAVRNTKLYLLFSNDSLAFEALGQFLLNCDDLVLIRLTTAILSRLIANYQPFRKLEICQKILLLSVNEIFKELNILTGRSFEIALEEEGENKGDREEKDKLRDLIFGDNDKVDRSNKGGYKRRPDQRDSENTLAPFFILLFQSLVANNFEAKGYTLNQKGKSGENICTAVLNCLEWVSKRLAGLNEIDIIQNASDLNLLMSIKRVKKVVVQFLIPFFDSGFLGQTEEPKTNREFSSLLKGDSLFAKFLDILLLELIVEEKVVSHSPEFRKFSAENSLSLVYADFLFIFYSLTVEESLCSDFASWFTKNKIVLKDHFSNFVKDLGSLKLGEKALFHTFLGISTFLRRVGSLENNSSHEETREVINLLVDCQFIKLGLNTAELFVHSEKAKVQEAHFWRIQAMEVVYLLLKVSKLGKKKFLEANGLTRVWEIVLAKWDEFKMVAVFIGIFNAIQEQRSTNRLDETDVKNVRNYMLGLFFKTSPAFMKNVTEGVNRYLENIGS